MKRCIYCLNEKDESLFNREHVVPEAFGTFKGNLVLDCVCQSCNSFFSKELDLKLARDTIEGLERFKSGLKQPQEFKSLGKRSTSRVEIVQDGPMKGVICEMRPKSDYPGFDIEPLPQIGLSNNEDGPFDFFLLDELPAKDELEKMGYAPGSEVFMRVWGTTLDEAISRLEPRGVQKGEELGQTMPDKGVVKSEYVFRISHPEFRAVTKIAMNYLAYVAGAGIVLMPQFNEARRYVTDGVRPSEQIVSIIPVVHFTRQSTDQKMTAHFVSIERRGMLIVAQVSLLCLIRYAIVLSRAPFALEFTLNSGHLFDLDRRQVTTFNPPQLWIAEKYSARHR